jgi:tetratricopeptide (TPR) repeat protein
VSLIATMNPYTYNAAADESKIATPQGRASRNLAERTAQLKRAESVKNDNPEGYIYALTTMASVVRDNDLANNNKKESLDADKYFDLAVDFFLTTKFDKEGNKRIACHLWQTSGTTSLKEFKAVFEKLCRASDRELGDDFGAVDADMSQALRNRSANRDNGIPVHEQIKFTERALAIRSAALGARSKTLSMLFFKIGQYQEELGETASAEQYYLKSGNLDSDASTKASRWQSLADFYLRHNEFTKAIDAWRQGTAITTKQHLNFYVDGEINMIKEFKKSNHPEYADEIITTLLANGNSRFFDSFDSYLLDAVDQSIKDTNFKKAQDLIQKRIAAGIRGEATSGLTDWKIRLSNVYLALGNKKDSEALFNQVLGSMALQGIQTDGLRRDRAELLERMGKTAESETLTKGLPKGSTAIIMKSPLMASDAIILGYNSRVTFFNSLDPSDKTLNRRFSPKPQSPHPPGFRTPTPPDEESILSLGQIRMEGNIFYDGKIFCRNLSNAERYHVNPVPAGFTINDALSPPPGTPAWTRMTNSGDYITSDTDLRIMGQPAPTALRIFLRDSTNYREFELRDFALTSSRQLQIWYNGTKKITLRNVSGLVYAPHAVVEIPVNSTFSGALVAKRIVCAGNNSINLDKAVVNQNFSKR